VLLQSSGRQSALIRQLAAYRQQGIHSSTRLKAEPGWKKLLSASRNVIKTGPLWRLQKLAGRDECFLYGHELHESKYIKLKPGIGFSFRRFYDLVVSLARSHWTQKIRDFSANHQLIGQGDLAGFLFGSERAALAKARPLLLDLQRGECFYCQKPLKQTGEVDHFIPWARYPSDLGHNFVLAHSQCNNSKRDHLAAEQHRERWFEQNIITHSNTIRDELSQHFTCESERSQAIAGWAYGLAAQNGSSLWLAPKQFVDVKVNALTAAATSALSGSRQQHDRRCATEGRCN